MNSVAKVCTL